MARGEVRRVYERMYRGKPFYLWVAIVRDKSGRVIWTDNSGMSPKVHQHLMTEAAKIANALSILEDKGHEVRWSWREVVDRAPTL